MSQPDPEHTCLACGGPPDGSLLTRVELAGRAGWLHSRCYDAGVLWAARSAHGLRGEALVGTSVGLIYGPDGPPPPDDVRPDAEVGP